MLHYVTINAAGKIRIPRGWWKCCA